MTMTVDPPEVSVAGFPYLELFGGLHGARRDQAYMAVEREVRRLQALQAAMVSEVKRSCSYVDDCHHSPTSWLRAVTNSSKATALHQVQVAAMLQRMPQLAARPPPARSAATSWCCCAGCGRMTAAATCSPIRTNC